jgi:prevent-host-death family protein
MKDRVVCATEFKAKCLALMDELEEKGGTITVTKRGRPVATVIPPKKTRYKSPMGSLVGKIKIVGDIANEDTSHLWNVMRESID